MPRSRLAAFALTLGLTAGCSASGVVTRPAPGTDASSPSSASPTTSSSSSSSSTSPEADEFTVAMSGDVLLHLPLIEQADEDAPGEAIDFGPMLAAQRRIIEPVDLAICHMETPLSTPNGPFTGYPTFNAPPQVVEGLKETGYDVCTTASNHTIDKGVAGVNRTLDRLDEAGIEHTGSARSAAEDHPLLYEVGDATVGLISATYGTNGIPIPAGKPWLVNLIDTEQILADARAAKADGADVVIVALHDGLEYQHEPSAAQLRVVETLAASEDVDLIYGHHVHVVQPMEKIGDTWVAYGLGNTLAKTSLEVENWLTREQYMARFTFDEQPDGSYAVSAAEYAPGLMPFHTPYRWVDLRAALADESLDPELRREYEEAAEHIREVVGSRGAFEDGLEVIGAP